VKFRVVVTDRARDDLDLRLGSLAERSAESAALFAARFKDALNRLESIPSSCGLAYENAAFSEVIRHLLIRIPNRRACLALFTIRGQEVVILAVRAPGERPVKPKDIGDAG